MSEEMQAQAVQAVEQATEAPESAVKVPQATEAPDSTPVISEVASEPDSSNNNSDGKTESADNPTWSPEGNQISVSINMGAIGGDEGVVMEVPISVSEDHAAMLKEAGLEPFEVAKELWSGEYGLSDKTREVLYQKYGKTPIDMALAGLKANAELQVLKAKASEKAAADADAEHWKYTLDMLGGGEEGQKVWDAIEAYAVKNFSEDEINEFNAIMDSGSKYAQRLAIMDLKNRVDSGTLNLIEGGDGSSSSSYPSGALTAAEYQQLFITGEYHKNPQVYDEMRRKGTAKGI